MDNNILITLTGKSGSGKSTIEKMLVNNHNFKRAVSHTSRPMRLNEQAGVDYYYISKEIMMSMYNQGKLAEFIEYNDNLYGVSVDELMNSQVIVIEPTGLKQVKEKMKDKKKIISFFLEISDQTMYDRMKKRGDEEYNIIKRISNDREHFNVDMNEFDYVINVDNLKPSQIINMIIDIISNHDQINIFDIIEGDNKK